MTRVVRAGVALEKNRGIVLLADWLGTSSFKVCRWMWRKPLEAAVDGIILHLKLEAAYTGPTQRGTAIFREAPLWHVGVGIADVHPRCIAAMRPDSRPSFKSRARLDCLEIGEVLGVVGGVHELQLHLRVLILILILALLGFVRDQGRRSRGTILFFGVSRASETCGPNAA